MSCLRACRRLACAPLPHLVCLAAPHLLRVSRCRPLSSGVLGVFLSSCSRGCARCGLAEAADAVSFLSHAGLPASSPLVALHQPDARCEPPNRLRSVFRPVRRRGGRRRRRGRDRSRRQRKRGWRRRQRRAAAQRAAIRAPLSTRGRLRVPRLADHARALHYHKATSPSTSRAASTGAPKHLPAPPVGQAS